MELSRTIEIKYNWWDDTDCYCDYVAEKLEEEAERRILEMRKEGYTSGELNYYEEKNCIEFRGWWELNYV